MQLTSARAPFHTPGMHATRIEALRDRMQAAGADAFVLAPGASLRYFTGQAIEPTDRLFLFFLHREGTTATVLPNFDEAKWREASPPGAAVFGWDDTEGPGSALNAAAEALPGIVTLLVEPLGLRFMEIEHLRAHFPKARLAAGDNLVFALRRRKSSEEAAAIREAAQIAESALEETLASVRIGRTEREIASHLTSLLLGKGGEGISFGPIVLSGPRSALPHGVPSDRPIAAGEFLLFDFGTSVRGYHCDITRTFAVGEPNAKMREVYSEVLAANERGRAACRPGATPHEIHHAAQDPLHETPFTAFLKHRTGHGLGLEIHEPPSIMDGNVERVDTGVVFTVEPGLYLDGWGGVRIEDDVWITRDGHETLTTFPRELRVIPP